MPDDVELYVDNIYRNPELNKKIGLFAQGELWRERESYINENVFVLCVIGRIEKECLRTRALVLFSTYI